MLAVNLWACFNVKLPVMNFNPRNILVIDFGQLGDVVLSLPALHAIRARFPAARITVAVGKPGKQVVELAACADDVLVVDRVKLRDGFIPASLWQIARLCTRLGCECPRICTPDDLLEH